MTIKYTDLFKFYLSTSSFGLLRLSVLLDLKRGLYQTEFERDIIKQL